MNLDQTDAHWRRIRVVLDAFGRFENIDEVTVEFVDDPEKAGARVRRDRVRLQVAHDWPRTVLAPGLSEVPGIFPVSAEPLESGRPDVALWRGRWLSYRDMYRQSGQDGRWYLTGNRLLSYHWGGLDEGYLARTTCGLGAAFHKTAAGAVTRAVRARGRVTAAKAREMVAELDRSS